MAIFTDHIHKTPRHWSRCAAIAAGGLIIFLFGFIQGEFSATQRLAKAASRAAPDAVTVMQTACPQRDVVSLSTECIVLLELLSMIGDQK